MYDKRQFEDLIRRVLCELAGDIGDQRIYSEAAVNLLLMTAAHESRFGEFLKQVNGPAVGPFQVEPLTFRDIQARFSDRVPTLVGRSVAELEWDLRLSIIVARLKYFSIPEALPNATDIFALAAYAKRHYNTRLGKATEMDYVHAYRRFVL